MEYGISLTIGIWLWLGIAVAMVVWRWRSKLPGVGLTIAYVAILGQLHWIGGAIYLPESPLPYSLTAVKGFMQSLYAVSAFAAGSLVINAILQRSEDVERVRVGSRLYETGRRYLPRLLILSGFAFYVLGVSPVSRLPSITPILGAGQDLFVLGLCVHALFAIVEERWEQLTITIGIAVLIPSLTLITSGFLYVGVIQVVIIFFFVAELYRPRWHLLVAGVVMLFFGLSIYVSYMQGRGQIRQVVWGGESLDNRVEVVTSMLGSAERFDPTNARHLYMVDARMSQNPLVGQTVEYLSETGNYARGTTLTQLFYAPIPRVIWAGKPAVVGGNRMASKYTGRTFDESTSVGVGHVMELYLNFGRPGVLVGFLVLGIIVTYLDARAGIALASGRWGRFVIFFLAGLPFLTASQHFGAIPNQLLAAVLVGWSIKAFILPYVTESPLPPSRQDVAASS